MRYLGPPMSLANMRQNGVRAIIAECLACHHKADVLVDQLDGGVFVPDVGRRMVERYWPQIEAVALALVEHGTLLKMQILDAIQSVQTARLVASGYVRPAEAGAATLSASAGRGKARY